MDDEKLIAGNGPAAEFLTNHGFPVSKSTFAKWSAPSSGIDTAVEAYWGQLPVRRPSRLLEWARSRLRPAPTTVAAPMQIAEPGAADSSNGRNETPRCEADPPARHADQRIEAANTP